MKRPFTLSSLVLSVLSLSAQCENVPMPSSVTVITTNGNYTQVGGSFWVCSGVQASINGMGLTIYAEANTELAVNGDYIIGFAKGPSTITNVGDTCFWSYENNVVYMGTGNLNFGSPCVPLSYDYTQAPTNGCVVNSVAEAVNPDVRAELLPNPAQDHLAVRVTGTTLRAADVLDMSGRELQHAYNDQARLLDVQQLLPGNYLLRLRTDKGTLMQRFQKN